ncbi:DUF2000 domain-containing protein [Isoptericola jiangsuensis]|uniref:DUF2000 domain-containing protein n=1 Tax=Isoptericola jiangsuensis TaxID=548579 RepID=UPI003AAF7DDF
MVVVDRDLATGLAVNAASIATSMIIHAVPELMGPAVKARDAELPGVILVPLPVLGADSATLEDLWNQCRGDGSVVDPFPFSTLAQSCRTYDEYVQRMADSEIADLRLAALGLHGPHKAVKALCGSLPLYSG